jgi:hypothetical protein
MIDNLLKIINYNNKKKKLIRKSLSEMSTSCKCYQLCIERSLVYAKDGNYREAIASFMSDVQKTECTKIITESGRFQFSKLILDLSTSDLKTFTEALSGFAIDCKCSD